MTAARMKKIPVALTIAGSDSGGGAGVQADLKTFAAFGVHGASAVTCVTAQNPGRVLDVEPCSPRLLRLQIEAVSHELKPAAVKTGMLFSSENIKTIADCLEHKDIPLVVDPVMVSTSGACLLQRDAVKILLERLLPLAALVTPNLSEAEILGRQRISSPEDMAQCARRLHSQFGCAVLIKGGHLRGSRRATDIFFDGRATLMLSAPWIKGVRTHGTGCVYSAAICAGLAQGKELAAAVQTAKQFITRAILKSYPVGNHSALGIGR